MTVPCTPPIILASGSYNFPDAIEKWSLSMTAKEMKTDWRAKQFV
jgi:hypothetical protein